MAIVSSAVSLRARGPLAVFTLPEFKAERVSAPVITPSSARGLLESVLWKPAIRWRVTRIQVLNEIRYTSFRRNEVVTKAIRPSAVVVEQGGTYPAFYADEDRAQRNTVALANVDYVIEAEIALTSRAGPGDNMPKFLDMFRRRIERGQHFQQPYFGCREFAADVSPADDAPPPIAVTRPLGRLLLDIVHGPTGARPIFFEAELRDGVLEIPPLPDTIA